MTLTPDALQLGPPVLAWDRLALLLCSAPLPPPSRCCCGPRPLRRWRRAR
ncbi:hypothetical protein [Deinococcus sp. RL]|nr:hypothetical protein [Deinococcus sp. RL]